MDIFEDYGECSYKLQLHNDDPLKQILFEIHCDETVTGHEIYEVFKHTCRTVLSNNIAWFEQGDNHSSWFRVEFWTKDKDAIKTLCAQVCEEAALTCEVKI